MNWVSQLKQWFNLEIETKAKALKPYIAALLFQAAQCYDLSNRYALAAVAMECPPEILAGTQQVLGDNLRDQHRYSESLLALRTALSICQQSSALNRRRARALATIGVVEEDLKRHERSIFLSKRAAKLARRCGELELEGKCLGNTGIALKNIGSKECLIRAIRFHETALQFATKLGDKRSEGRTLGNIGITWSDLGEKGKAIEYYGRARRIAEDLGDRRHTGIWHINAGIDYLGIDSQKASEHLLAAKAIFTELELRQYLKECETYLTRVQGGATSPSS